MVEELGEEDMRFEKLGPADFRTMPWKNGGGTTTELLVDPPGGGFETGFRWRLSTAQVASSGPFSPFPGYDRTLLILEGDGMELDHGPHGHQRLDVLGSPVAFDGAWPTTGNLLGGPCRDFNVMSRQGACRHTLRVLHPGAEGLRLEAAPTRLLYVLRGGLEVKPSGLALEAGELLRVEGSGDLDVASASPGGAALLAVAFF
jgi:environmental stress-induced protein Ves